MLPKIKAKDNFLNINNVSRDDMMAAHRVPLQKRLQELNDWLGKEVIRFEAYTLNVQE